MMAVEISIEEGFSVGVPKQLFETQWKDAFGNHVDISPDGQTFLINMPIREEAADPIILIQNWTADLGR